MLLQSPAPIARGTYYASNTNIHFFLCHLSDMTDKFSDIQCFTGKVAELHRQGTSPNEKHAFDVPNFYGEIGSVYCLDRHVGGFFTALIQQLRTQIEET